MTDEDTRLDARVRGALTTLPVPDDATTREALTTVLGRTGPVTRRSSLRWLSPAAAAATVAAIASVVAWVVTSSDDQPAPVAPPSITGTWERRSGGVWEMTLTADGVLVLDGPPGSPSSEGASWDDLGGRIRVDAFVNSACPELPAGSYAWVVKGDTLTLTVDDDPCLPRATLLAGTWHATT